MILVTEEAGIIAPGDGEASNWNTSLHMPELNIGPAMKQSKQKLLASEVIDITIKVEQYKLQVPHFFNRIKKKKIKYTEFRCKLENLI